MSSIRFKEMLTNGWLSLLTRITLAGIFLYAAWDKFLNPRDFAIIIAAYKILPSPLINLTAILLPSIEIVLGIALLIGLFPRGASLIMGGMMVAFIFAFLIAALKGVNLSDCGCFSTTYPIEDSAKGSNYTYFFMLRDLGYLILAVQVFFARHKFALQNVLAKQ